MKKRLLVSVSGGRTSAYMARWLAQNKADEYDMLFVLANTSREHADTLRFVGAVNEHLLDNRLIMVEAAVWSGKRAGTSFRVVTLEEARIQGEVFEDVIRKYGIPNKSFPHCTRELKQRPIRAFARMIWGDDYQTAIGIRIDEAKRRSANAAADRIVYPLLDWHPEPPEKADILDWFRQFDWDLRIPEHLGNCVECWKKSDAKLNEVYRAATETAFRWTDRMERHYGEVKAAGEKTPGPRVFFRMSRSSADMLKLFGYLGDTSRFVDDTSGGCTESCEPFGDEEAKQS